MDVVQGSNIWLILGIVIIVIGFAMKLDSIAVVLTAAIVTALIGGIDFMKILEILGESFVKSRGMSIFVLTLPIVGMSERYGLREEAVKLIQKLASLTAGRVMFLYQVIRQFAAAFSLRLGGHAQFVRPLIHPMAEGAAINIRQGDLTDKEVEEIKGAAAAVENYGNFFGQNLFPAASGVALIVGTLADLNIEGATNTSIAMWSIPIFVISIILSGIQLTLLDKKIKRGGKK